MAKSFLKGKNYSRLFIAISIILFLITVYLIYTNTTNETNYASKVRSNSTTQSPSILIPPGMVDIRNDFLEGSDSTTQSPSIHTRSPNENGSDSTTQSPSMSNGNALLDIPTSIEGKCSDVAPKGRYKKNRVGQCQCDNRCAEGLGGCCSDKKDVNPFPTDLEFLKKAGARGYGPTNHPFADKCNNEHVKCGEYIHSKLCQCDDNCTGYNDCCDDYIETCKATTPTPTST